MRIIAGKWKGRKLATPFGEEIRPTSEKVKEAVFSMLLPWLQDAVAVDLFSGTGGMGLEALSRGAARVYFCDKARSSMDLTKRNIKACGAEEESICYLGEWERCLERIREKSDLFFLDPPYHAGLLERCMERISDLDLLSSDGIIVAEHGIGLELPDSIGGLMKQKERRYGKIVITVFACAEQTLF